MNRREFFNTAGPIMMGLAYASKTSIAEAQEIHEIVGSILTKRVWLDQSNYERLRRLVWVTYSLRIAYRMEFNEVTGLNPGEIGAYSEAIYRSLGKTSKDGYQTLLPKAVNLLDQNDEELFDEFTKSSTEKVTKFAAWLNAINVSPSGRLGSDLLRAQAFFSLFDLAVRGFFSFEDRRSADATSNDDCWWPYPFC